MGTSFKTALNKSTMLIVRQAKAPISISIEQLTGSSGGMGIALFFLFLKFTTIAFGIMSFVSIASIIILSQNDGLKLNKEITIFDYNAYMAMISLGNISLPDKDEFFVEKLGYNIEEVYLARNYNNTLLYYQELIDTFQKLQEAKDQEEEEKEEKSSFKKWLQSTFPNQFDDVVILQKLYEKQSKSIIDRVLKQNNLDSPIKHDEYQSVLAYVVFKYQRDRVKAFKELDKYSDTFVKSSIPQNYLFDDEYVLKVSKRVDEPNSIKWENLEVSNAERHAKSWLVSLLLLFFIALCFSLIVFVNLFKPQSSSSQCTQEEWNNTQISWYIIYPEIDNTNCQKAFFNSVSGVVISLVIGLFVFIVNFLLKKIIKSFIKFMRYSNISQEIKASTNQIFKAQLLNTGLLITVLQFDFQGFKFSEGIVQLASMIGIEDTNEVVYVNDFTRDFYMDIGGKIVITALMLIITPIFEVLVLVPFFKNRRIKKAKKKKTQYEMDKALVPPIFDLATFYAAILNTIFIAMIYSSGIPILNIIAFLALFTYYNVLKYKMLRVSKKPDDIDASINKNVLNILPLGLFFHLIVGIFMYATNEIVPLQNQGLVNSSTSVILSSLGYENDKSYFVLISRLCHNFSYTVFSVVLFLIYLILIKLVKIILKIKKKNKQKDDEEDDEEILNPQTYSETQQQLNDYGLTSYDIRQNAAYSLLVQYIDNSTDQIDINMDEEQRKKLEEEKMKNLLDQQQQNIKQQEAKQYKKEKEIFANQEYAAEKLKQKEEEEQKLKEMGKFFEEEEIDYEKIEQNLQNLSDYQNSQEGDDEKNQNEQKKKKYQIFSSRYDLDGAISVTESQMAELKEKQIISSYKEQKLGLFRKNKRNNKILPLENQQIQDFYWQENITKEDLNILNQDIKQDKTSIQLNSNNNINSQQNLVSQQDLGTSQTNIDKSNINNTSNNQIKIQDQGQQNNNINISSFDRGSTSDRKLISQSNISQNNQRNKTPIKSQQRKNRKQNQNYSLSDNKSGKDGEQINSKKNIDSSQNFEDKQFQNYSFQDKDQQFDQSNIQENNKN